jgi:dTDP-4-amino-4,6-dideoxygalactose transaminase
MNDANGRLVQTGQTRRIGVGTADITPGDRARVNEVLQSGRLSAGSATSAFEAAFAAVHERRHGAFCNSGTGALQLALQALKERHGWRAGDEVVVPAMTFVATVNVVLFNNLRPVLADIDLDTYNVDPAAVASAVTERTVAIMPAHLFGQPCDMTSLMRIADDRGLRVIEDSCETVGVRHKGRMVGAFGDFGCFSTYMAHIVTTGVGGLALTDDQENITRFRSLMNHGRNPRYLRIDDDQNLDDEGLLEVVWSRYDFHSLGQSFRATEMEAALGIGQLERLSENLARRRHVAAGLMEVLDHPDLKLPQTADGNEHAFMMFPVLCRVPKMRDKLVVALERAGIETRFLVPIIGQPCYEGVLDFPKDAYPNARQTLESGFYIGSHPGMTDDDIAYIGNVVASAIGRGASS